MNIPGMSPEVMAQLEANQRDKQRIIDAAKIQQLSTAENIAKHIYDQVVKYQSNLNATNDVALVITQFSQSTTILVQNIGYIGYNLVCFYGRGTDGKPLELIQHISQLNLLLTVAEKSKPETPKRKIGFAGRVEG